MLSTEIFKKVPGDSSTKGAIKESYQYLTIIDLDVTLNYRMTNASTQTENGTQKDTKHSDEYKILKQSTNTYNTLAKLIFFKINLP